MRKKLLIFGLLISFIFPIYADVVLFMKPVIKEIDKSESSKIIKDLESVVESKFNSVSYKNVSKSKMSKFRKCGMNAECWYEHASEENFQYVLLSLINMNEDEEVITRFVLIHVENEEIVEDFSKTYDYVDDISKRTLFASLKSVASSVYDDIKGGKKSKKSDEDDEIAKRIKKEKEREEKVKEERAKKEEERRNKLEEERRKREQELEKQKEKERRLAKERERKQKIEEERQRREEEAERERLEKERLRREKEKKQEEVAKRQSLKDNAEKLSRARELVLEMCSQGKYNAAIKAVVKVSEIKCECEEDAKVLALKTQLLNFNKVREKILEGVKLQDASLILDNIEAAKALDQSIVPEGTEFSHKVDKYAAVGYMARGAEMEKVDNYILANEAYEKCLEIDPEKSECSDWLESKDKLVKKIYDKATVMKNFNPTKAKELFRSILKLVTAENEFYKKAEAELQKMEY